MKHNRFDFITALYAFCCHYHTGQWSRGYRILSRIEALYRPHNIPIERIANGHDEWIDAHEIYNELVKKYRNKV